MPKFLKLETYELLHWHNMKLKVEGHPDLIRDSKSKAIINVNQTAMNEYKHNKNMRSNVQVLSDEMTLLKDEFSEIKVLLRQIAAKVQ